MKKTLKFALIAMIFATTFSSLTIDVDASYKVSGTVNVLYNLSGSYYIGGTDLRIVNEMLSIDIDTSDDAAIITFNYNLADMPYNIDEQLFIATREEIESMNKMGSSLWYGTSSNPFDVSYGANTVETYIYLTNLVLVCRWDSCTGILIYCEVRVEGEAQRVLYIKYYSSTVDIYGCIDADRVTEINMIKFIASPAGMVLIALPFISFTIIILYISKTKKKIKTRQGRALTK